MTGELPVILPPGRQNNVPQGPGYAPSQDPERLRRLLGPTGYELAQQSDGWGDTALSFAEGVAKGAADGVAHLSSLAFKGLASMGVASYGADFSTGWQAAEQSLQGLTGTKSPGALDFIGAALDLPKAQVFDPYSGQLREVTYGEAGDIRLQEKLGRAKIGADVAGMVLSFGGAPGRALGAVGEAAARPMTLLAERAVAKGLAKTAVEKGVMGATEVKALLDSGRAYDVLAKMPELRAPLRTMKGFMQAWGRQTPDIISTGAANMVQSYGLLNDDQRMDGLFWGAVTAPVAVPLARVGQHLAGKMMAWRLTPEQAAAAKNVHTALEAGKVTIPQAIKQWNQIVPHVDRAGSALIAGAFEGTSMMLLEPEAWTLAGQYFLEGDLEAGKDLFTMLAASAAMTASMKYAIPMEMAPLFKELRPDVNRLDLVLAAKANEDTIQAVSEGPPPRQEPTMQPESGVNPEDVRVRGKGLSKKYGAKEWQFPDSHDLTEAAKLIPLDHDLVAYAPGESPTYVAKNIKTGKEKAFTAREIADLQDSRKSPEFSAQEKKAADAIRAKKASQKPAKAAEKPAAAEDPMAAMQDAQTTRTATEEWQDATVEAYRQQKEAEYQQRFEWAKAPSDPFLRAGFDANVVDDATIQFTLGRDHAIYLSNRDGEVVLDMQPETAAILGQFGRKADDYEVLAPTRVRFKGDAVKRVTDDLTLLSQFRRMDFDLDMAVLGQRQAEMSSDFWMLSGAAPAQVQLDGSRIVYRPGEQPTVENVTTVRGFDDLQAYPDSPTLGVLVQAIANKAAVAPDPLIDGVLTNAVLLARYSPSRGGEALRQFFAETPPDQLLAMMGTGRDKALAFMLGSLGGGTNNPAFARTEFPQILQKLDALRTDATLDRQFQDAETLTRSDGRDEYMQALEGEPAANQAELNRRQDEAQRMAAERQEAEFQQATEEAAVAEQAWADEANKPGKPSAVARREALAQGLLNRSIDGRETVEVPINAFGAARLYELVGKNSAIGKQLANVIASKRRSTIRVPFSEFKAFAKTWAKYADKDIGYMRPEAAKALGEANQSADFWMSEVSKAFDAKEVRLQDLLSNPESGFVINPTAEMGSLKPVTREEAARIAKGIEKGYDYTFEPTRDLLYGKGDDAYATETRTVMANYRGNVGKRQPLMAKVERAAKKAKASLSKTFSDDRGESPRWKALIDNRAKPETKAEAEFQKVAQQLLRDLRNEIVDAGGVRTEMGPEGTPVTRPLTKTEATVFPRMMSEKGRANLADDAGFRERFLQAIIDRNNLQLTPDEVAAKFFTPPSATKVSDPNRESAVEFRRELKWFPDTFEGKEILDPDVFGSLRRIVHQQSGRAATLKQWGPDLSPGERKALAAEFPEFDVSRPGVKGRLEAFASKQTFSPDTAELARNVVTSLEGGSPKRANDILRALYGFDSVPRALLTSASFIHDIGDVFNKGMMYGGVRRALGLLSKIVTSPKELMMMAERYGTVLRGTGAQDPTEATSWWRKIADGAASVGTLTEKIKTGYHTRLADQMLADWKAGKSIENDRFVLSDMLRLPPEMQQALLAGKASADVESVFRQEFVQLLTSRRLAHEGSQFAGNPSVKALVRFTGWATGNLMATARLYKSLAKDAFSRDPKRMARAGVRAAKHGLGTVASGAVGQMLAYAFADMFRGENGFKRYFDELALAPWQTLAKGALGQITGGPYATMISAFTNPDQARSWATLTTPMALYYALTQAAQRVDASSPEMLAKTLPEAVTEFHKDAFLPSWAKHPLNTLMGVGMAGSDPRALSARRMASTFMRLEGIEQAQFPRNKEPEFYEAMRAVAKIGSRHFDDPGMAYTLAEEHLRKALEMAPEESVAATLRSYSLLDRIPADKLDAFAQMMGDDLMTYAYAHDDALRTMAKLAALKEGTPQRKFEEELATAENQARLGNRRIWNSLVDRSVDEAAQRLSLKEPIGEDIRDLSASMAAFYEQQEWLSEAQMRSLSRRQSQAEKARYIERILTSRARNRRKTDEQRTREAEKQFGVDLTR